jgi:DNA-binding NarL/FixJ family response regulator
MTIPECEISESTDYRETQHALENNSFFLVFVDLNMPDSNGLSDLALLKKMHPQIPMVVVSAHEDPDVIRACINHNASGYISKSSAPENIQNAIQTILQGNTYVPPGVNLNKPNTSTHQNVAGLIGTLTPSQLKVFIEMGKGKLNKQIAYDLDITEATVKAHITSVFKKLHINNRTQAVILAKEHQTDEQLVAKTL